MLIRRISSKWTQKKVLSEALERLKPLSNGERLVRYYEKKAVRKADPDSVFPPEWLL